MARPITPSTVGVAVLAGVAGLAGSYAVAGSSPAFVGAPVSSFVVRTMPAAVVTFSIVTLGKLGSALGFLLALALAGALLGVAALAGLVAGNRFDVPLAPTLGATAFGWLVAVGLTRAPIAAVGAAVPVGLVVAAAERASTPSSSGGTRFSRRDVAAGLGGVAAFGGLSLLIGAHRRTDGATDAADTTVGGDLADTAIGRRIRAARAKELDVEGLPGLVSDAGSFFEVDINPVNPEVTPAEWGLTVTGEVETEVEVSYDALTSMPAEHRFLTLRCVGDPLNGDLLDTALWTGVPVAALLDRASPQGTHVRLRAVDGYDVVFPLEALQSGLLAYRMNGAPLPAKHGAPVRALVPGHWGEVNVKWLTEIEVLSRSADGYWERRGWHGTGPVITIAKLWTKNRLADGRLQVAGHAYAGTRGIQRVEVSVDDGATWHDATLSDPLDGAATWRQWSYEWRSDGGPQAVVVRAVDGEGTVQPRGDANPFPRGAAGWVSEIVEG